MGKGSGSSHTPVTQSDTLKSKQKLSVLDLISAGPIKGFVESDILKSIQLNSTFVKSSDGYDNITGVSAVANYGNKDQDYLPGFASSKAEVSVGSDVLYEQPVSRTITRHVDRMVLTVGGDSLYSYEDNGDMNRTNLSMRVEIYQNNKWIQKARLDLNDQKSESEWLVPLEITDLPEPPFDIRVVRETKTSTSTKLRNACFWRSYTEISDTKQSFPYCAVVGMTIDSEQFGSSPTRNYLIDGIICQVPSNYNPDDRTYTGFWDGTFKPAYTNNPAWIYYTIATDEVYGCGDYITGDMLDIYRLYSISKYCDELIDDGFGNKEPRFTCNGVITEQKKARELLNDIASVFNGMPVWSGVINSVSIDYPGDITAQYVNANVIGDFQYSSSELEDRHSVVEVTYCDPKNGYEKGIEYVSDSKLIDRYGYNVKKITAFGCTSRGQARRAGLYILETEKQQTRLVTFKTGIQGLRNIPGDLIEIADNAWSGAQISGRVVEVYNNKKIKLDRDIQAGNTINFDKGELVYFGYLNNKEFKKIRVIGISDDFVCDLESPAENIKEYQVFSITRENVQPITYRCMSVKFDSAKKEFDISAVQHSAKKYSDIDNNTYFGDDVNTGSLYSTIPTVKNLTVNYESIEADSNVVIRFDCPTAGSNIKYRVQINRYDLSYFSDDIDSTTLRLKINDTGNYTVYVTCVSMDNNRMGTANSASFTIAAPSPVSSISWTATNFDVSLRPVAGAVAELGDQYQWFFGSTEQEVLSATNYLGRAYIMNKTGLKPNTEYWFGCRVINPIGISSIKTVLTKTILNSDDLLAVIAPDIPNIDYIKEMNKDIEGLSNLASLRVVDPNGATPRVSGIYANGGNAAIGKASTLDVVADYFAISSPDSFDRWVYFNTQKKMLTILGDIQAKSGTLDNVTINENCVVKGKMTAGQIEGDIGDLLAGQSFEGNITFNSSTQQYAYQLCKVKRSPYVDSKIVIFPSGSLPNGKNIEDYNNPNVSQPDSRYRGSIFIEAYKSSNIIVSANYDEGSIEFYRKYAFNGFSTMTIGTIEVTIPAGNGYAYIVLRCEPTTFSNSLMYAMRASYNVYCSRANNVLSN